MRLSGGITRKQLTDLNERRKAMRTEWYYDLLVYVLEEGDEEVTCDYTGEVMQPGQKYCKVCGSDWNEEISGYISFDYFMDNRDDFEICSDCYNVIDRDNDFGERARGGYVCAYCIDHNCYFPCEDCGLLIESDDYEVAEIHTSPYPWHDSPFYVCGDCADDYWRCDDCGNYYTNDVDSIETRDGGYICSECFDNSYCVCDGCNEVVPNNEIEYCGGNCLCEDCYSEESDRAIGDYHSHSRYDLDKYNINGKIEWGDLQKPENKLTIGHELEVEDGENRNKMASDLIEFMDNHIYCEHDGSLDGETGFEMIFKPHTDDAFRALPLRDMFRKLINAGFTSHDNGHCGLHIHFANEWFGDTRLEQDDNVAKVIHFYNEQYDFLFKCSRRAERDARDWAKRTPCENFEEAKRVKDYYDDDRYCAVNTTNMSSFGTVEFRLGRGTLRYESFMAWHDIHVAIARNAKTIEPNDIDINHWLKGITDETKEYILERTGKVVA